MRRDLLGDAPPGAPSPARSAPAPPRATARPPNRAPRPPRGLRRAARHAAPGRRQPTADLIAQPRLLLRQRRPLATPCRAASAAALGTRTSRHTRALARSTPAPASSPASAHRADPFSSAAPADSPRCSPNPPRDSRCPAAQRAMNPEPIAAGFITAHHRRASPAGQSAAAPAAAPASTAARSPPATVRSHGATPNPDVIASFHPSSPARTPHTTPARLHSPQSGSLRSSVSSWL